MYSRKFHPRQSDILSFVEPRAHANKPTLSYHPLHLPETQDLSDTHSTKQLQSIV